MFDITMEGFMFPKPTFPNVTVEDLKSTTLNCSYCHYNGEPRVVSGKTKYPILTCPKCLRIATVRKYS